MKVYKLIILLTFIFTISSCGGGDETEVVILPDNETVPTDSYQDSRFNPYGVFEGNLASEGTIIYVMTSISKEFNDYFRLFVLGAGNARLEYGPYLSDGNEQYSTVDRESSMYTGVSSSIFIDDSDAYFKFNFDNHLLEYKWKIDEAGSDIKYVPLVAADDVASEISRTQSFPSNISLISGQFVTNAQQLLSNDIVVTWDIDDIGNIQGLDTNGCSYDGVITIENQHINLYRISLDISLCSLRGEYTGHLLPSDGDTDGLDKIMMTIKTNTNALFIEASRN